jgi:hypothetical protein
MVGEMSIPIAFSHRFERGYKSLPIPQPKSTLIEGEKSALTFCRM